MLVSGGLEEEIQVELDERKLASLGLSIDQVRARLAAENVNLTGGRLREGQTEYLVRTINEYLRPEDMAPIVLQRSGDAIIRLADVARIFTGHKDREIITRIDGHESVELAIYKEGGTNTVTVSDAVAARMDSLREELDPHRSQPQARADHRPGALHPPVGQRGPPDRPVRRHPRHPRAVLLPALCQDER